MRRATLMLLGLLAVTGACPTNEGTGGAVAPAPAARQPRAPTATTPPEEPAVAVPVAEGLVHYGVSGRHTGESFVVAADGTYTLDVDDDGAPSATGTLTAAELSRLRAEVAATTGVAPPRAPEVLRSESPPVVSVATLAASAAAPRYDDMPGPWGALAADLAALMTAHRPEPSFVATLASDATHLTLRQRGATPVSACFAVAVVTVLGRGDAVVRSWESPPLEPGAAAPELAHGPRRATCTPSPRAPGWTLEIPLAAGAPRRGETMYASIHAVVSDESTTVSAEPLEPRTAPG